MPLIEVLGVFDTDLTALDVSRCTRLMRLNCVRTGISDMSVESLVSLEQLYIYGTTIRRLDLTMLPKLREVWGCTENDRVVLTAEGVERRM